MGRAQGFSITEIVVAISILGLGAMGYLGIQLEASRQGQLALTQTKATLIANDLIERIRANPAAARAGFYVVDPAATVTLGPGHCASPLATVSAESRCSAEEMASQDLADIQQQVHAQLPAGILRIDPCDGNYCLYLGWQGDGKDQCQLGPEFTHVINTHDHCLAMTVAL